ncbi:MAG: murein biosynthesis integral membrane protein MurJ [Acidimicrobiales bacterium]
MTEEPATPSLPRAAGVMAVGTVLSRVTGLGRLVAMAFALGVTESRLADSYNIANTMPNVLYELVLGGVLTSVFLPVVVSELRTRDHDEAWEAVSCVATLALGVLLAMTVVAAVAAPWIVRLFTLRVSGPEAADQQAVATFFLRWFAPQIVLYGAAAIAGALLNAHQRFAVPMFAPILNNLVVISTFLAFAAMVSGTPSNAGIAESSGARLLLALGTTGGVAAMAAAYWPSLRRLPGRLRPRLNLRHPAVARLARLSGWTTGYVVANQVGFGIVFALANGIQGGPTAFSIAFAFFQLPYGVIAVSVMTALFPRLSGQAADGDIEGLRSSMATGLRTVSLFMLPATAGYLVLSRPLVSVLLEHGVMGRASGALVASVLEMFGLGLLPFSAFILMLRGFFAFQDARTPMLVNLAANTVLVVAAFGLFPLMGVRGLALAHSLSYVAAAALAWTALSARTGGLQGRRTAIDLAKVAAASVAAGLAMRAVGDLADERPLAQLVGGGLAGLAVFVGLALVLKVEELGALTRLMPRKVALKDGE